MITAFHNLKLITNGRIASGKAVLIADNTIIDVIDEAVIPSQAQKVDLLGSCLAPGFIDLQIYGSGGKLFGGSTGIGALEQMETDLLEQGTTGFFATVGTNSNAVFEQAIAWAREYSLNKKGNFLGLHLEGPYINPKRKGAHSTDHIRKGNLKELQNWVEKGEGVIKMMTIAPELQDQEVIDYLIDQGIIISSGHSDASYTEAKAFLHNPIKAITHLYNAMPQMHHREPGVIPAIFEEKPYTSIVADGIHVDFAMIRLAKRELGNKLFLITDAVTQTLEGAYPLHEFKIDHYVMPPHGTLSGSSLTMLKAVGNCVKHAGIELAEAVNMASLYPAQLAGLSGKGKIEKGYDADMVIFNDTYQVEATVFKGDYLTK
jgi:N-acetylglucosamine-6-phosphate deacetylase